MKIRIRIKNVSYGIYVINFYNRFKLSLFISIAYNNCLIIKSQKGYYFFDRFRKANIERDIV